MARLNRVHPNRTPRRTAAAAVEAAMIAPVLVLLFLGAVDLGQYANTYQILSNASAEGARVAARTDSSTEVQEAVIDYFKDAIPNAPEGELENAVRVYVWGVDDEGGLSSDVTGAGSGAPVVVYVLLNYNSVRWVSGFSALGGKTQIAFTVMRRE